VANFTSRLQKNVHIALLGNPNGGKTSLFNALTGLNQQVGNFPGVTVDKKIGSCALNEQLHANIIDLPGTYSIYPKRADEWVAYNVLMGQDADTPIDIVVLVVDASNLQRNLLFCTQVIDLKIPTIVALTMVDVAKQNGTEIDIAGMERELGVPIVAINPRKNKGISTLKKAIEKMEELGRPLPARVFIDDIAAVQEVLQPATDILPQFTKYKKLHFLINEASLNINADEKVKIAALKQQVNFNATKIQAQEILQRYVRIKQIMQQTVAEKDPLKQSLFTQKLDDILLHKVWGYAILLAVLFLLFQTVYFVAQYPMDGIEWVFAKGNGFLKSVLPNNFLTSLFTDGIIAGLSGIVVFVPQIMLLFGLITLLEDTGYMARISFLSDKLMRKVGLNGKSVMPMISGYACAVPAIMSARNIENKKERLLTILVTPLMSCSARLPVYTILIGLVIPSKLFLGFISLQGLVMMLMYLFGTVLALLVAWIFKFFIKSKERSFFILELPIYRSPRWKNIVNTMIEKAKIFVWDAGKVIMVISILLWLLSSFGPSKKRDAIEKDFAARMQLADSAQQVELGRAKKAAMLENSYAAIIGKTIEPSIQPLGFDWRIGIALITSFAAREVFVGTMATLYAADENADENDIMLRNKMAHAVRADGSKVYDLATGLSLMIFYVIAMQCMSTLAIVKRETKTWKWPIIQFVYMTALAYLCSWLVYIAFK
jgi:ferrous iron transport protein B